MIGKLIQAHSSGEIPLNAHGSGKLWVSLRAGMAALWLSVFAATAEEGGRKPGTIRMAERLSELVRQADPIKTRWFGSGFAEHLRQEIESTPSTSPAQRARLRLQLGLALLELGRNEEALEQFTLLEQISPAAGILSRQDRANILLNEALAHLRIAELSNCLSNHNSDSCLVPLEGGGIHTWKEPARQAIGVLTRLLLDFPDLIPAKWLLNLAYMATGEYPEGVPPKWRIPPKEFASEYEIKRFVDVAGPAGLARNDLSGGSVVEDLDGDGLLDVMVSSSGLSDQMHFYRNKGDGTFEDRTESAGLPGLTGGLNMVSADYNNDGHVDVLVLRGAWLQEQGKFPNSLLKNHGDGTFEDVTESAGILSFHPTQTAAWFDFDGDGWLDLFIGNETHGGSRHACELYRNNGDGSFTEMAAPAGLNVHAYVKGVVAGDFNNDGRPDLFLSALREPNMLFQNDGPKNAEEGALGGWKFTNRAAEAGVEYPLASFSCFFFDYDNDGWEDLFCSGYGIRDVGDIVAPLFGEESSGERARLYRNRGNGTFEDVSRSARVDQVLHAMGLNFGDLDNDGWLDFYAGTGDTDLLTIVPNRMFRNWQGRHFQDVTTSGGFGNLQKGHGISFADVDNDGDQDVFEEMGGAFPGDTYPNVLFLNPGHGNHWLSLELVGVKANRAAIGARVKVNLVEPSGKHAVHRVAGTGGSFGCNPLRLHIGIGKAAVESVEIQWPGSKTHQIVTGLRINSFYRLHEGKEKAELMEVQKIAMPSPSSPIHEHRH